MKHWILILAWLTNVLILSVPVAIFEILLERDKGWGSGLRPHGWGTRLFGGSAVARLFEKPYVTAYHVLMFVLVVPTVFVGEYLILRTIGVGLSISGGAFGTSKQFLAIQFGEVRLIPLLYLLAVWFSFLAVEDFFWFALNWYYPKSMQDLLSGKIWWHTRWVHVGSVKLPRFYLSLHLLSALFLVANVQLAG